VEHVNLLLNFRCITRLEGHIVNVLSIESLVIFCFESNHILRPHNAALFSVGLLNLSH
jgi:hypothetical protein